jgi:hypothetical protein
MNIVRPVPLKLLSLTSSVLKKGRRSFCMSTLNLIVFAFVFLSTILSFIVADRIVKKKWIFKMSPFFIFIALILALFSLRASDCMSDEFVKLNVAHEWKEQIITTQNVEDVVRSREKEGSFFFGIGDTYERETFRYTVLNDDFSKSREKLYTNGCIILKANDGKQKIVYLRNVRAYKDPADKKFFQNMHDHSDGFYRVYL